MRIELERLGKELLPALIAVALTLPQGISFALMAGVNPEYGLSLCLIPMLVALWLSRSPFLLSGPNTAVSLLLFSAALPFAVPYSADFHGIVLVITGVAAIWQCLFAALKLGRLFLALPLPIVHAIISGTGLLIILSQLGMAVGVTTNGTSLYENAGQALSAKSNLFAVATTMVTVASGLLARKSRTPGVAIVYGFAQGVIFSLICRYLFGDEIVNLPLLGRVEFPMAWFAVPQIEWNNQALWLAVVQAGFAVAVIGSLQAVIIAVALARAQGTPLNLDREILAQSGMNVAAAITGSFAGAASFNRSLANLQSGGSGKLTGVVAVLLMALFVVYGAGVLKNTPLAVVAGTLILSGLGLLLSVNWRDFDSLWHYGMFLATYLCVIGVGLVSAIIAGAAIAVYAAIVAAPSAQSTATPQRTATADGEI